MLIDVFLILILVSGMAYFHLYGRNMVSSNITLVKCKSVYCYSKLCIHVYVCSDLCKFNGSSLSYSYNSHKFLVPRDRRTGVAAVRLLVKQFQENSRHFKRSCIIGDGAGNATYVYD